MKYLTFHFGQNKRTKTGDMILILSKNQSETEQLQAILAEEKRVGKVLRSLDELHSNLENSTALAAFIDIDSVCVDNRSIRKLTLKHRSIYFFCMSWDKFHPELKDAICYHIYACLNKPIDPDELAYWLKCISSSENESRSPPPENDAFHMDKAT